MNYPETIRWAADGRSIEIIDQRALPEREQRLHLRNAQEVASAIRELSIRGAPAIGVAAAMGVALEPCRHRCHRHHGQCGRLAHAAR